MNGGVRLAAGGTRVRTRPLRRSRPRETKEACRRPVRISTRNGIKYLTRRPSSLSRRRPRAHTEKIRKSKNTKKSYDKKVDLKRRKVKGSKDQAKN